MLTYPDPNYPHDVPIPAATTPRNGPPARYAKFMDLVLRGAVDCCGDGHIACYRTPTRRRRPQPSIVRPRRAS
jgi:hypothetical protein